MTLVLFLIVRVQGFVNGEEFSPTDFQQRSFSFYEIPLIGVQITPIRRAGSTTETARYLRQNSLIRSQPGSPPLWHLVRITRRLLGSTPADAQLLVEQLSLQPRREPHWKKWSIEHPEHARVFWPVIQRLATRELYILMPALFEQAQRHQSPSELQEAIDRYLRREYRELILEMRAAGRDELADQLLLEAKEDYPDDFQWTELATLRST